MRGVEDVAPNLLFEPRAVAFELDRFELAEGRLELTGRWFGVNGLRFMRPSLILRSDDGETRLLADLADKPWSAENGEPWRAAFPCDGELDVDDDAELTVAPDLTVEVRVPDAARSRRGGRKRTGDPKPRQSVTQERVQDEQSRALSSARSEITTLRKRVEELGGELERERARLASELRDAEQAMADALQSREQAIAASRKAIESREVVQKTIEQALTARGKAMRTAEHALAEREEALARLDKALSQRDQALAQRDEAAARRDEAAAQRDEAAAQRDEAAARRDKAAKDLERATGERDELARANEQLRRQYDDAIATRGAAMVMRNATVPFSTERRHAHRLAAAIAVTSLLIVTIVLVIILSSH